MENIVKLIFWNQYMIIIGNSLLRYKCKLKDIIQTQALPSR